MIIRYVHYIITLDRSFFFFCFSFGTKNNKFDLNNIIKTYVYTDRRYTFKREDLNRNLIPRNAIECLHNAFVRRPAHVKNDSKLTGHLMHELLLFLATEQKLRVSIKHRKSASVVIIRANSANFDPQRSLWSGNGVFNVPAITHDNISLVPQLLRHYICIYTYRKYNCVNHSSGTHCVWLMTV